MSALAFSRVRFLAPLLVLGLALAVAAACGGDEGGGQAPAAQETPPLGETPAGGQAAAEIKMLPGIRFDRSELTIPADTEVTITVDNTDGRHSFAVYASEAAAQSGADPIAETEICTAPCTDSITVNLSAGQYFFRCQVHPTIMKGTLIAE